MKEYLVKSRISKFENKAAENLGIKVTDALADELLEIEHQEGLCKSEDDGYRRVKLASDRLVVKRGPETKSERERISATMYEFLKHFPPKERKEQWKEIQEEVENKLKV
jgi:hypothetical protein